MKYRSLFVVWGFAMCAWLASLNSASAQGTAFTYQGRLLSNNVAVTGNYDMQFVLYLAPTGTNQTGPILTNAPVAVTNGLFLTTLDFGDAYNVSPLYLGIGVRTNGSTNAYLVLSPRQLLTSAPYAVQALNATAFTGAIADGQLSANVPLLNGSPTFTGTVTFSNATGNFNGALSGTFSGAASGTFSGAASGTFSGASSGTFSGSTTGTNTGKFIGDGSSVTNLNVTNIVGVVQSNPNWQLIQSTTQTAVLGNNYLATNSALTTLTLPAGPGVGNTIWIAGSGANGWVIAQPASQSIVTAPLGLPAGQNWNVSFSSSQTWHALASSTNGIRLAAAYGTGFIYYSTNGGASWTESDAPSENWSSLASSADGTHMVAAPNNSAAYVYTSTNGGAHWTQQTTGLSAGLLYHSVASSADGISLVAATDSGLGALYLSSNGGSNWTASVSGQNWNAVASSADGTHLAAATSSGLVYTTTDSGAIWTSNSIAVSPPTPTGIASSADGSALAVTSNFGNIYTSGNGGASWTPRAFQESWSGIASSLDGRNLAAVYNVGFVYTSSDGGQTWLQRTNGLVPSGQAWSAIASSGDGSRLVAAVSSGEIYNSVAATTPGASGSLAGTQYSNVQLQYIGNGQWMPLNFTGSFTGN